MRDAAIRTASWCMFVLDQRFSASIAPPSLMPIYRAAWNRLADEEAGKVTFDVPEGCRVYLNGSPQSDGKLYQRSYEVFAGCPDGDSQIHVLTLGDVPTDFSLDVAFDRALVIANDGPRLVTIDAERAAEWAERLSQLLAAGNVLLVKQSPEGIEIELIHGAKRVLSPNFSQKELEEALGQVMRPQDVTRPEKG